MKVVRRILLGLVVFVVLIAVAGTTFWAVQHHRTEVTQDQLDPFYTPPDPLPAGQPGELIRSEPMTNFSELTNTTALRILYYTKAADEKLTVSSGMVFFPNSPSTTDRKVVAYGHPTSGFGNPCAPSRNPHTPKDMPWIQTMMDKGWALTVTDYAGLGTPGEPQFLIGRSEANDVLYSVRALRHLQAAHAGTDVVLMGHSAGGHAALASATYAKQTAPELNILGASLSAPATQLAAVIDQQWNTGVGWAIGPDTLVSWPTVYPQIQPERLLTETGLKHYRQIAYQCVTESLLEGQLATAFGDNLFVANPIHDPGFGPPLNEQTPNPPAPDLPVQLEQSTGDGIVLPNTTALFVQRSCAAKSNLQTNWLPPLASGPLAGIQTHTDTVLDAWPTMVNWIADRFAGVPATSNCGQPLPVAAYGS